ncbi:MAG: hypothetical protein Q4P28_04810 [Tissierellia bacterium]|nr:hypothetical protein [Tissierellia bacterium]
MTALEVVKFIMYLALAGFLVALIVFFLKLSALIKEINATVTDSKKDINRSVAELPSIMRNVSGITDKADRLIGDISPDVKDITRSVNHTISSVENATEDVTSTVSYVTESVSDTATNIKYGLSGSGDTMGYLFEIIDFIKMIIRR